MAKDLTFFGQIWVNITMNVILRLKCSKYNSQGHEIVQIHLFLSYLVHLLSSLTQKTLILSIMINQSNNLNAALEIKDSLLLFKCGRKVYSNSFVSFQNTMSLLFSLFYHKIWSSKYMQIYRVLISSLVTLCLTII